MQTFTVCSLSRMISHRSMLILEYLLTKKKKEKKGLMRLFLFTMKSSKKRLIIFFRKKLHVIECFGNDSLTSNLASKLLTADN